MTFSDICQNKLKEKGLSEDKKYLKRLKWETEEIVAKKKEGYFLDLYERKVKYPKNENNLLVCWLLDIVPDYMIEEEPNCIFGESPDIDQDYLPACRDWLKNIWAPAEFGQEYVCNIGNYTTFGLKSSLIDMARVHGESREEILALTKSLDSKDDEGKTLTWDAAMKLYPDLKKYCDAHPDIADAAHKLLNRNRGSGIHAGGLIISRIPLTDLVPLIKRKDAPQASAWVEGLHGQDLQPVGLVKFDLLVISNLLQIARCCEMVKQRHKLDGICAKTGLPDWTDIQKWRSDKKSLEMANKGDLKGIFQFDSEGIRKIAIAGGVDRFEDLVAYSAIFRPGPLGQSMHTRYIERKRKREKYSLHPLLKPILEKTYGVMIFQEDVMKILNVVGDIPLEDCEIVRKAISKKKIETFIKYKEMFLINGKRNLGCDEKEINSLWNQMESFSEYGFCKTLTEDTIIKSSSGFKYIKDFKVGDKVYAINKFGEQVETEVLNVHDHGRMNVFEILFDDGYKCKCTLDHKFLTINGQEPLWKIIKDKSFILCSPLKGDQNAKKRLGSKLWRNFKKSKGFLSAQKKLLRLPKNSSRKYSKQTCKCCSMWTEIFKSNFISRSSKGLRNLHEKSMERKKSKIYIKMWNRFFPIFRTCFASSNMRNLHENKKRKYSEKNGQVEFRKFKSREKENIFRNSKKNISTSRNKEETGRKVEKMDEGKSRKICRKYKISSTLCKKIKNGDMVKRKIEYRKFLCSMQFGQEICGFSKRKYLDRGRRTFSFLGNSKENIKERQQFVCSAKKRRNVENRSVEEKRYLSSSFKYVLFSQKRGNERGLVHFSPEYDAIADTRSLVSRRILRILPVGKRQCYDLEVSCSTHNFILPNGVITSNSHAVAYNYLSMYSLYLKSHYPEEFYASILSCEKLTDKIKEYKMEATLHKIEVCRLDINKSKENFDLQGNQIYYGFSNVKGIGIEPAKRIVENQPYGSFEDFLKRFGTDASVLKPLLGLRCFEEKDPVTLWKFSEYFKDCQQKNAGKEKRKNESLEKYEAEFKVLIPEETRKLSDFEGENPFDSEKYKLLYDIEEHKEVDKEVECEETEGVARWVIETKKLDGMEIEQECLKYFKKIKVKKKWNRWRTLKMLWNKRKKLFEKQLEEDFLPSLADFNANQWPISQELAKDFSDPVACEERFYGFAWIHDLERSPDYTGNLTFENLKNSMDHVGTVEIKIVKVAEIKSRKGTTYHQITAEDATGQENKINIWEEDWGWYSKDFVPGNLFRVKLQPPSGGFNTFTLENNHSGFIRSNKKFKTKDDDYRVYPLRQEEKKERFLTDEEVLAQFEDCVL